MRNSLVFLMLVLLVLSCVDFVKSENAPREKPCKIEKELYTDLRVELNPFDSLLYDRFMNGEFEEIAAEDFPIESDLAMGAKIISFLETDKIDSAKKLLKPILNEICVFSDSFRDYPRDVLELIPPFTGYAFFRFDHYYFERRDRENRILFGGLLSGNNFDELYFLLYDTERSRQYANVIENVLNQEYFDSLIKRYPNFHYFKLLKYEMICFYDGEYYNWYNDALSAINDVYNSGYRTKWCTNEKVMLFDVFNEYDSMNYYENLYLNRYNEVAPRIKEYDSIIEERGPNAYR